MIMPSQDILKALKGAVPMLESVHGDERLLIHPKQIQPASFDFGIGSKGYHVQSSALAYDKRVEEMLTEDGHCKGVLSLTPDEKQLLIKGQTYVFVIKESCTLLPNQCIVFSPKSSTGRDDVFVRVLCNPQSGQRAQFNRTPYGYHGPLYLEVTPLSFDVMVSAGLSLVQGRFKTNETKLLANHEVLDLQREYGVLRDFSGKPLLPNQFKVENGKMSLTVDLSREVVGFEAKTSGRQILDLQPEEGKEYWPADFWEPIFAPPDGQLVLVPGVFYLLVVKERVRIPMPVCGHVLEYELESGNIQVHYAGFFDPGFDGAAVMEVRARDVAYRIGHGQTIAAMAFERMQRVPKRRYKGNYTDPRPSLSKRFKFRNEAWQRKHWQAP